MGADRWMLLEERWARRIDLENQRLKEEGRPPLSRYHASDCESLTGEFRGWNRERQQALLGDLLQIVQEYRPCGIATSASLREFGEVFPGLPEHVRRKRCYQACVLNCLEDLRLLMRDYYPQEKVSVFHDHGDFVAPAQEVFSKFECDQILTLAPLRWQDCIALQSADLIACAFR